MSIVDSLPSRSITTDEIEVLEKSDQIQDIAPAAFKSSLRNGEGVAEMVLTTNNVVVGLALITGEWEILYQGEIGNDGSQDDLFHEAYDTLEDSPKTPS